MKTQSMDQADARFLGGIGFVLLSATLAVGLVLLTSLPLQPSSIRVENSSQAMLTGRVGPVLEPLDLTKVSKDNGSLTGVLIQGSVN
jgi:hypothetical protein